MRSNPQYHVAHEGCLKLYCEQIGVPFNLTPSGLETMLALIERHEFLGPTLYGGYEGIDYSAGKLDERWLSQPCGGEDANVFAWDFERGQEDWTMKRYHNFLAFVNYSPDLFPRLHKEVKPERLALCNNPKASTDWITNSPDLVFLGVSSHLSLPDLYNVAALSKQLRRRCLTTASFQLIVRDQISQTWAAPMTSEYPSPMPEGFPHGKANGDWFLYGHHVFKTNSMRNRRRILNIISQLQIQYIATATEAGYLEGPHSGQMRANLRAMVELQLLLRKVSQMYDYQLFLKVLDMFNDAWARDLRKPRFKGEDAQKALKEARRLVEGKEVLPRRDPGKLVLQRLENSLRENQGLVMAAKRAGSKSRRREKGNTTFFEGTIPSNGS